MPDGLVTRRALRRPLRGSARNLGPPPPPPPPTPATILGAKCKLWFNASNVQLGIGVKVAQANDLSGSSNPVVNPTFANQPSKVDSVLDGKPAIRFGGSASVAHWLRQPAFAGLPTGGPPPEIFLVAKTNNDNEVNVPMIFRTSDLMLQQGANSWNFDHAGVRLTYSAALPSGYRLYRLLLSPAWTLSLNGVQVASRAAAAATLASDLNDLIIGSFVAANLYPLNGDVLEYVVCNQPVTAGELTSLMGYFTAQYPSLGLPTTQELTIQGNPLTIQGNPLAITH